VRLSRRFEAPFKSGSVIGFKDAQAGLKKLAFRHDNDVESRRDVIVAENLSYQSFSAISLNRAAELFCRRDAQTARDQFVGPNKQCAVTAMHSCALLIDLLKVGVAQDPLARAEPQQPIRC
jgi:hypothetical protein